MSLFPQNKNYIDVHWRIIEILQRTSLLWLLLFIRPTMNTLSYNHTECQVEHQAGHQLAASSAVARSHWNTCTSSPDAPKLVPLPISKRHHIPNVLNPDAYLDALLANFSHNQRRILPIFIFGLQMIYLL